MRTHQRCKEITMRVFGLLLCLFVVLGFAACMLDRDAEPDVATDVATQSTGPTSTPQLAASAEDVSNAGAPAQATDPACAISATGEAVPSCCSSSQGCPVPIRLESRWIACRTACVRNGGTVAACRSTCCLQYTNCSKCYQQ
jgi:hypothetical protein